MLILCFFVTLHSIFGKNYNIKTFRTSITYDNYRNKK